MNKDPNFIITGRRFGKGTASATGASDALLLDQTGIRLMVGRFIEALIRIRIHWKDLKGFLILGT